MDLGPAGRFDLRTGWPERPTAARHSQEDRSPKRRVLESDPEQLRQVLLNLVINAIQAMPGGGEIEVAIIGLRRGVISVKDQGTGIRRGNLDRIFDPFFTTKEAGTGLGLSVAHQVITQHGGIIEAERNPDRGMTFSLSLPLRARSKP